MSYLDDLARYVDQMIEQVDFSTANKKIKSFLLMILIVLALTLGLFSLLQLLPMIGSKLEGIYTPKEIGTALLGLSFGLSLIVFIVAVIKSK